MTDLPVRYCRGCGRQMIPFHEFAGFSESTGEPQYEMTLVCPRFSRSWRNLWMGGWSHYGADINGDSQFGSIELEVGWR